MTHKKLIDDYVATGVGFIAAAVACACAAAVTSGFPEEANLPRIVLLMVVAVGFFLLGGGGLVVIVSTFFPSWYEEVPWTREHWNELVAFKSAVNERLDAWSVPGRHGPDSPCRVEKRLDRLEKRLKERDDYFDTVEAMLLAATGVGDLLQARVMIDMAGPKPSHFIARLREQALGEREPDEVLALMSDRLLCEELFRRFDHAIFAGLVVTKINEKTSHLAATGDYNTRTAHQGNHVTCLGLAAEVVQTIQDYEASQARVRSGYDGKV